MKLRQDETASTAPVVLWKIAETDNTDQVEALLACGVDINVGNIHGTTALMRAASNGRIRMVQSLLNHGPCFVSPSRFPVAIALHCSGIVVF